MPEGCPGHLMILENNALESGDALALYEPALNDFPFRLPNERIEHIRGKV